MRSLLVPVAGAVLLLLTGTGCTSGGRAQDAAPSAPARPTSAAGLERLLLTEVPSGLPRVPDHELEPAAGRKTAADLAGYAPDPAHQREVLEDYGYQWGWERFWRSGDELTSVFLDQFSRAEGAGNYAADLAGNDEEYYGGELDTSPARLPPGCTLLTVDDPGTSGRLTGPSAMSWCAAGPFTLQVAAVSTSPEAALAELEAVTTAQLDRLPAG
ncbi:hypothetical protein [Modestobacter sp. NPDC049651]|uniref:hypothetical protein n=1 Tax=unclassified Modestobacter TaxID=2643866 RepID=UPI0033D36957